MAGPGQQTQQPLHIVQGAGGVVEANKWREGVRLGKLKDFDIEDRKQSCFRSVGEIKMLWVEVLERTK